jgi:hypothetical protein
MLLTLSKDEIPMDDIYAYSDAVASGEKPKE